MNGQGVQSKEKNLLHHLGNMSKMVVYNHGKHNLTEFVLHDLCSEKGFNINKAAYLVNNPDFYVLQGVAGYHRPDAYLKEHWGATEHFTEHMKQSLFNKLVRDHAFKHFDKDSSAERDKIQEVAEVLKFEKPQYHTWNLKYDNHGLFIYETDEQNDLLDDHLLDYLHVLGHCPVF